MPIHIAPAERGRSTLPIVAVARTLPRGFVIPTHQHDSGRLIYSVSGTIDIETADGTYVVPPSMALWVPPGTWHGLSSASQVALRSLDFSEAAGTGLPKTCRVIAVDPLLREIILRLTEAGPDYDPKGHTARIAALVPHEVVRATELPLGLRMPADPRLRRLCGLILADPADPRSLPELGRAVGASARTATRLFSAETGMTFVKWRQHARLMRALALLSDGRSITETALDVGYETPSAFIRLYQRYLRTTPGQAHG